MSEVKNTLNQINGRLDIEIKTKKKILVNLKSQEQKLPKTKQTTARENKNVKSISELWDKFKHTNTPGTGIVQREDGKGAEKVFK